MSSRLPRFLFRMSRPSSTSPRMTLGLHRLVHVHRQLPLCPPLSLQLQPQLQRQLPL
jgi:hypothetical protein